MFLHINNVKYIKDDTLQIMFNNGVVKLVDLQHELEREVFEPLNMSILANNTVTYFTADVSFYRRERRERREKDVERFFLCGTLRPLRPKMLSNELPRRKDADNPVKETFAFSRLRGEFSYFR